MRKIYNEDGDLLFSGDNAACIEYLTVSGWVLIGTSLYDSWFRYKGYIE